MSKKAVNATAVRVKSGIFGIKRAYLSDTDTYLMDVSRDTEEGLYFLINGALVSFKTTALPPGESTSSKTNPLAVAAGILILYLFFCILIGHH